MNVRLLPIVIVMTTVGCATTAPPATVSTPVPQTAPAHPYAMPAPTYRVVPQAPTWFVKLPENTTDMIFSAGTATSTDEQMAYDKARMAAESKLIEQMTSHIKSLTKNYRNDRGETLQESFEQVIQKTANGQLIGTQRVDSQVTHDGRNYKVYVLLRYPLGENNVLRREQDSNKAKREADLRSGRAHQDLEQSTKSQAAEKERLDKQLKEEIGPRATVPPGTVAPVPAADGTFRLLDVENADYIRRRAEALEKPGAVVGQVTVR